MIRLLLAAVLVATGSSAGAVGAIYRCGADGRTFSQTPCANGTLVEASDPRTAAQRAEARRVAAAERQAAAAAAAASAASAPAATTAAAPRK